MKDIGSIFPLYDSDLKQLSDCEQVMDRDNSITFSLCREALYFIAETIHDNCKKVLLPAYTCDTVITPFLEQGWECFFFPVNKALRIDIEQVRSICSENCISLIIVHPYYGMDLNQDEVSLLKELHGRGCRIVVDLTQNLFSSQNLEFVDYYVGSYRKWYAIPDGGFLGTPKKLASFDEKLTENEEFVTLQTDAMYLRGLYFDSGNEEVKSISRRLNKKAVELVKTHIAPHKMAAISKVLMARENKNENQIRRMANYKLLFEHLVDQKGIRLVCEDLVEVTSAPLYFTVYAQDRQNLQAALAAEHVYAPVIWPLANEKVLVNDTIKEIYDTILAIPIDQRYDEADMGKIIKIIKQHYND